MYLKSIELRGFKSFGDSTTIKVPKGITAVIGPNGCGKSNIADAIRWVLGEQSAKLLRGDTMQDVIFSGTQNRKGLGFAQVSATIDNTQGDINIEYSEIVVTRRLYKSGESEYLINKSPCRLKDIHELFMNTGVGREGYSIIGQGEIDKILSSRPEDRRSLFDEAAGIYKYKVRKAEAEKKLEKEEENLIRVQDIIAEIESRLETLGNQAKMAKGYLSVSEKLKKVELNMFLKKADKFSEQLHNLKKSYAELQSDYNLNSESLKNNKKDYEILRKQLNKMDTSIYLVQEGITSLMMEVEKKEGNINVYLERLEGTRETIFRLENDNKKRKEKTLEQKLEIEKFLSEEKAIKLNIENKEVKLSELESKYKSIEKNFKKLEGQLEECLNNKYNLIAKSADVNISTDKRDIISRQVKDRKKQIEKSLKNLKQNKEEKNMRKKALEKDVQELREKSELLGTSIENLNRNILANKKEKEYIDEEEKTTKDIYYKSRSRYKALTQMKEEYEGFFRSVKNILDLKKKDPQRWASIYGVVGELLTVPKNLETAIDVALGNRMQNIVIEDEESANILVDYIKKHKLGRATFLPLTSIKGYTLGHAAESIKKEQGVKGIASDLVDYKDIYTDIITSLLGRVVIVDNMKNAIVLARKYNYRYRLVTLEGEVLNPGGSITGGNFQSSRSNVFTRTRAIDDLEVEIKKYKLDLTSIHETQKNIEKTHIDLKDNLEKQKTQNTVNANKQVQLTMEIDNNINLLDKIDEEIVLLKKETSSLDLELEEIASNKDNTSSLDEIKKEIASCEEKEKSLKNKIKETDIERDRISNQITDIKIDLSSENQSLKSIKLQIERSNKEIQGNSFENSSYKELLGEKNKELTKLKDRISSLKEKNKLKKEKLKQKNIKLKEKNEEKISYLEKEEEVRKKQGKLTEENALLQKDIYRMDNQISKITSEKEHIYNRIWNEYEVTYEKALNYKKDLGDLSKLEELQKRYKSEIKKMGIINTVAIDEYRQTKERYDFLSGQEQDIIKAEKTLEKLIDDLTQSMEKIFKEEFEKISENFNKVFIELFGGGQAFLKLTESDNALESGIEIIAQPPGKKLQNMMLLSGGERALTAIAILFGILILKPSPFAVLDEIEAALDEANVVRFANYLKKMGESMQFIVITHRKGTMAIADTIYGVTMEEQGVSKTLSIQLDETSKYIS